MWIVFAVGMTGQLHQVLAMTRPSIKSALAQARESTHRNLPQHTTMLIDQEGSTVHLKTEPNAKTHPSTQGKYSAEAPLASTPSRPLMRQAPNTKSKEGLVTKLGGDRGAKATVVMGSEGGIQEFKFTGPEGASLAEESDSQAPVPVAAAPPVVAPVAPVTPAAAPPAAAAAAAPAGVPPAAGSAAGSSASGGSGIGTFFLLVVILVVCVALALWLVVEAQRGRNRDAGGLDSDTPVTRSGTYSSRFGGHPRRSRGHSFAASTSEKEVKSQRSAIKHKTDAVGKLAAVGRGNYKESKEAAKKGRTQSADPAALRSQPEAPPESAAPRTQRGSSPEAERRRPSSDTRDGAAERPKDEAMAGSDSMTSHASKGTLTKLIGSHVKRSDSQPRSPSAGSVGRSPSRPREQAPEVVVGESGTEVEC